ncbi:Cobalt transport protein CbiM [Methanosarcinaceae archaeon Ag5]|uniref:Putative cobalt transport protein CbiM n=1 Tax=Methanolapillus africanus TaxID=3028297 RepID=A0AAE4SF76_9EURY|nr:Cobalt transport protein CbiM [Methanosarcinaceae archaeon Ag5]
MHIAEGYLPLPWAAFWWIVTLVILVIGIHQLNKMVAKNREALPLLALSGAFIFVLSSLKLPSAVGGSSSHPTGTGLSSIIFGPFITAVLAAIVLIFQALFIAHGGLTTFGANCFSMGFFGPLLAWCCYKILPKGKISIFINVFISAFIADLATYIMTSLQLALAFGLKGGIETFIDQLTVFLGIFALTQVPLAFIEGIIVVIAVIFISLVKGDFLVKAGTFTEEQVKGIAEFSRGGKK